jgi:class 3 adenylate cyclase/tetratricopeptide (TPR) repeat protein
MATCSSCGAQVDPAARFCPSCGSPLGRTCPACGASVADDARFCSSCGTPLEERAEAGRGEERKLVTILFADVTGSTTLGEQLDPESLRDVMDRYFAAMREEVEAEGGTVEKFIGDAVMVAFGVPVAHEDDASRALRAGLRMLARLPEVNRGLEAAHGIGLQIRIGVHTGEVLATVDAAPGDAMVIGDAVNAAARLQTAAEPGELLASERTLRAARGFEAVDRGPLELKGKRERVRAFAVTAESGGPTRGLPGLHAPMVGRAAELDLLRSVYERAVHEGRPHLTTIYGDAGVGKSRLTREFVAWAEGREPVPSILTGRCLPYGDGITYWPLAEILKSHAGILDSDPGELAVEKLRKAGRELLTTETSADPQRATAALAYTIGLEDPEVPFADLDPKEVRAEVHAAWRSFFTALALDGPVVAIVEDIHWADPALLDLLEELADRVLGPVLFLAPSRPELTATRPTWGGGRRNTSAVALDPLTAEEANELVSLLLSVDDLPPSVHGRILERVEGNPFYLEEVIRGLIDAGLIVREADRWRATEGVEDVEIPDTVQAVLASRIDLLDPQDKRILQAAAVVGRVFWPGAVSALTGLASGELAEPLRRLEDRELVTSRLGSSLASEPELLFKHILTRDVAYESIPRRERPGSHAVVAAWLERSAPDRLAEFAELLAYHYATAATPVDGTGVPDEDLRAAALRWLERASEDARRRYVLKKAERLAGEALSLSVTPLERVDALESLGEAFGEDYAGDLAWRYFREAAFLRAGTEPPDGSRVAHLAARACDYPLRWPGSMRTATPEGDVRETLELGLAHLPPGDSEQRVRLLGNRAAWPFSFPEFALAEGPEPYVAAGVEAAEMAMRLGLPNLASASFDHAAGAWSAIGRYRESLPLWERRRLVMDGVTDGLELGDFYAMGMWVRYELGDYEEAIAIWAEGLPRVGSLGGKTRVHMLSWHVVTLHRLGRWDEALTWFDELRDLLDERRDDPPYFATHAFGASALIRGSRGETVEADRLVGILGSLTTALSARLKPWLVRVLVRRGELDRAATLSRAPAWRVHGGDLLEAESELVAGLGDASRAAELAAEMRRLAEANGTKSLVPFADLLEGRMAMDRGDGEVSVAALTSAADGFAALGCPWERALAEVDLALALRAAGRADDAGSVAGSAFATFDALDAIADAAAARRRLEA